MIPESGRRAWFLHALTLKVELIVLYFLLQFDVELLSIKQDNFGYVPYLFCGYPASLCVLFLLQNLRVSKNILTEWIVFYLQFSR